MSRYPAPYAEKVWSDQERAVRLRQASDEYASEALRRGLLGLTDMDWAQSAIATIRKAPDPAPEEWRGYEELFGHEIVGFLAAYLQRLPEEIHPYIHYGLTSSDLVEYELHEGISRHAAALRIEVLDLAQVLFRLAEEHRNTERAGRTHGQTAELTTLGHQFDVFRCTLGRHNKDFLHFRDGVAPIKSPGPTGYSEEIWSPWRESVPSTQIVPRDFLLRWASMYLNLSNTLETMAMFVRLGSRSEIGEFREGAAKDRQGSSAMPGKANPIGSEKVCGLARVARGHFLAISEVSALWEDRDLSNSSTERLAVPGLAGTVEHMLGSMISIFNGLDVNTDRIALNASDPRCQMNARQREIQRTQKVGPIEASRLATERDNQS